MKKTFKNYLAIFLAVLSFSSIAFAATQNSINNNLTNIANLTSNGLVKTSGGNGALSIATAGTDYLAPAAIGVTVQGYNASTTILGNTTTGSGSIVLATSPSFTTPSLGVATATSINGATITSGTLNGTVTGTNTGDQTITLTGDATGSGTGSFVVNVGKINGVALSGLATGILKNTTGTGVPSIAVAGDFPTLNQNTTGSAATLTTSRNIQGVAFNGSADINPINGTGFVKVTGTTLSYDNSTYLTTSSASSTYQPLDSDLTTIAGLTATTNNFLQSVGSAWASRTPTQVTATLDAFVGDSGSGGLKGLVPTPGVGDATKFLKGDGTWATLAGGGDALVANPLSQFASTTSAQLLGVISDETGSGSLVFNTDPQFTKIGIGVAPSSRLLLVQGNVSGGIMTIDRTNTATTGNFGTSIMKVTSTGQMTDGFGPSIAFALQDADAVENVVGNIGMFRNGSDSVADMYLSPGGISAGVFYGATGYASFSNIGIGSTLPDSSSALSANGNTAGISRALSFAQQLKPLANISTYGIFAGGTVTTAATGTHAMIAQGYFNAPSVTSGGASVTNTATVYISGQSTATVTGTNYALWVDAGLSALDGNVTIGGTDLTLNGTNTGINITGISTEPSAPASGTLRLYSKSIAGKMTLKVKSPSGLDYPLQSALWQNNVTMWAPTTATGGLWVGTAGAGAGTYTTQLPTTTSLYTAMKRARYANVVTTTNQVLGQRNTEAMYFLGNTAGQGGFFYYARVGFDVWTNGGRFFAGMHSGTTVISADPSALNNTVGFAVDAADNGAISFLTRSTSATKASTGFTITSGKGYDLFIFVPTNSTTVNWRIVDINAGTEASGSTSTTVPAVNTMLTAGALASNAALTTATAIQIGINKIYIETDY